MKFFATWALLLASLLFCIPALAQKPLDKRLAGLDTFVNRILSEWHAAGVGIAVVEKNNIVYTGGFGYRDLSRKLPVSANTLFAIGSCTKAFTATIIGMLDSEGKLDIDKPLINYLPDFRLYNDWLTMHVTPRDMMCHRTGLPRHDMSWYGFPTTRDSFIYRMRFFEPSAELREKWQYNNFMFLTQGVLAEKITGKSWEQNVRDRIFTPLGMRNTVFSISDMTRSFDFARGYFEKKDSIRPMPYFNIDAIGPAGSINSCPADMAKWVMTWINGGKFGGKEVIPATHVTEATSSQMTIGGGLPTKETPDVYFSNYGFGWFLSSFRGHYRVEHGGNIDGFSASTSFFPSDSIGIVVLVNQNGSSVPAIIRNFIAEKMLGLSIRNWSATLKDARDKAQAAAKALQGADSLSNKNKNPATHPLAAYTGIFSHPGYGTITVRQVKDSLIATTPTLRMWFQQLNYDIFRPVLFMEGQDLEEDNPIRFQFNTGLSGDIESLSATGLEPSVKKIDFVRKDIPARITKSELDKYPGDYSINGTIAKVYLKGETLFISVPGQPDYETVAVGNNEFKIKAAEGYSLKFEVNVRNEVTALFFVQPNGTFRAEKIK